MSELYFLRLWFWGSTILLGIALANIRRIWNDESLADRIVRRCKEEGIQVVEGDRMYVVKK